MAKGYCVHPRVPEMKGARPNEQARKILKPILILLTTQFPRVANHRSDVSKFFNSHPTVRLPSNSLGVASLPYKSGSIGSTFPCLASRPRALEGHFVVFCHLMSGLGCARSGAGRKHLET